MKKTVTLFMALISASVMAQDYIPYVTTVGNVESNGVAVFSDASGRHIKNVGSAYDATLIAHQIKTGTNVHGLGTASTASTTNFDAAGSASVVSNYVSDTFGYVPASLSNHVAATGTNVHGLGTMALRSTNDFTLASAFNAYTSYVATLVQYTPTNTLASTAYTPATTYVTRVEWLAGANPKVTLGEDADGAHYAFTNLDDVVLDTGKKLSDSIGVVWDADVDGNNKLLTNLLDVSLMSGVSLMSVFTNQQYNPTNPLADSAYIESTNFALATSVLADANSDGYGYVRQNAAWSRFPNFGSVGISSFTSAGTLTINTTNDKVSWGGQDLATESYVTNAILSSTTNTMLRDGSVAMTGTLPMDGQSISFGGNLLSFDTADYALAFNATNIADATLQIGQESYVLVKNESGVTVTNGQAVYISGASGFRVTIELASATNGAPDKCIGLATHTITNNAIGFVTMFGLVRGMDTDHLIEGAPVYLGNVPGILSTNAGTDEVIIGTVSRKHNSLGSIFVNPHHAPYHDADAVAAGIAYGFITNATGGSGTFNHPSLTNLQGDASYQHITTAQVAKVDAAISIADATNATMNLLTNRETCAKFQEVQIGATTNSPFTISCTAGGDAQFGMVTLNAYAFSGVGSALTGISAIQVGAVPTNDTRYLAAITNIIVNGVTGTVSAGVASLTELDTNNVQKTGDTVSGAILTTRTNAPAANEFITDSRMMNYVDGKLANGVIYYTSTNTTTSGYSTNSFVYQTTKPDTFTRSYAAVTANQYIGECFTPTMITNPIGPAVVTAFIGLSGAGSPAASVRPELYFTTDKTNTVYEAADVETKALTVGTNIYTWAFVFPPQATAYVMRRFKVMSVAQTPTVTICGGTNQASSLSLSGAATGGAGTDTNTVLALINNSYWTPYNLASAPTNTITLAMGRSIRLALTNTTYITIADDWATNQVGAFTLSFNAGGQAYSWNTSAVSGTPTLVIPTNGPPVPLYFRHNIDVPYASTPWSVRQ